MATQQQLPAGKTQCFAASPTMRIFVDRDTGEPSKLIVPLKIEVGAAQVEHSEFMTIDPSAETSKGKARIDFTIAALKCLGAKSPAADIANALDSGASEVTFAWAEQVDWTPCTVKHNGQYINLEIGAGVELDPKKAKSAAARLRAMGGGAEVVNPFAPPAGRGTPIAPPARREPPRNEITPEEAAAMAEEPGFPFGANASAK